MESQKEIIKEYSNGEITIVWQPAKCIHATLCWKELISVFNPDKRPWIDPEGASTERIIQQVDRCPTDALTYYRNEDKINNKKEELKMKETENEKTKVEVVPGGPLIITGCLSIKDQKGEEKQACGTNAFCRCSKSNSQPYCDGSHLKSGFKS